MNLWIRSQDRKRLTKVEDIYMIEDEKNFTSYIDNNIVGHLGEYKKVDRALEVLDEIQNILKPTIITTGYECELKENIKDKTSFNLDMIPTKTEIQELSTVVYQMPEK